MLDIPTPLSNLHRETEYFAVQVLVCYDQEMFYNFTFSDIVEARKFLELLNSPASTETFKNKYKTNKVKSYQKTLKLQHGHIL